jgi:signal transduction histidine kinase
VARIETQLALRAATKRLISQEKLASLGTLTAGVAHEIRNPLNFIKNFAEASLDALESADDLLSADELDRSKLIEITGELTSSLSLIPKHVSRIDSVVTNMLGFSQDYLAALQLTDIGELVSTFTDLGYQGYRGMGHPDFLARVNLKTSEPIAARVYPQEIGRVVVNLVSNACDAMRSLKEQGISRQPELNIEVERIGEEFGIRVQDNGIGIPSNLREHVFVPFFTTKPPGEGTGLGLGLCRDIVVGLHNGEMEMESEQGVGTTVRITIPIDEVPGGASPSPR